MKNRRSGISAILTRKSIHLSCVLAGLMLLFPATRTLAFIVSEEQQFEADMTEAIVRAKDFQRTMDTKAREIKEREIHASKHKEERKRIEEEREKDRQAFIRWRNSLPDPHLEMERLEREHQKKLDNETREMERARVRYVNERDRVREVMKREAYINEMVEYGLESP